jgi:hypothetical protein
MAKIKSLTLFLSLNGLIQAISIDSNQAAPATTVASPTNNDTITTTVDPYLKDLKSQKYLKYFWEGHKPFSGDSYNVWCRRVMQRKNHAILKKHALSWINDDPKVTNYLPGPKDIFYQEQFTKYDSDFDGLLDFEELSVRQNDINNLVNGPLGFEENFEAFENTLVKTALRDQKGLDENSILLDYDDFVLYSVITDMIHGYALKQMHNNYATIKKLDKPNNSYVCIAEFGWMMRIWISLTGQYNGPYEKADRNSDFKEKYAIKNRLGNKLRMDTFMLAAWRARIFNDLLAGRPIYNEFNDY